MAGQVQMSKGALSERSESPLDRLGATLSEVEGSKGWSNGPLSPRTKKLDNTHHCSRASHLNEDGTG